MKLYKVRKSQPVRVYLIYAAVERLGNTLSWLIHNYFSKLLDINLYNITHFLYDLSTDCLLCGYFLIILNFCTNNIKLHAQMYMKFTPQFSFLFFMRSLCPFLQSYWDFKRFFNKLNQAALRLIHSIKNFDLKPKMYTKIKGKKRQDRAFSFMREWTAHPLLSTASLFKNMQKQIV